MFLGRAGRAVRDWWVSSRTNGLRWIQRIRYRALADPERAVQVRLEDIRYLIRDSEMRKRYYPGVVVRSFGDQSLIDRSDASERRLKPRAIHDHFLHNVPWEETELFRTRYSDRLRAGETIRGCRSMDELIRDYETNIDRLFESLKVHGIKAPDPSNPDIDPVVLHIGPGGEFISGANGNHRLYMADLLSLERGWFRIFARHERWQEVRECANRGRGYLDSRGLGHYASHPDLVDLLQ